MRRHHRHYLNYLLWRGLVPAVFLAEQLYLRARRVDWEEIGFKLLCAGVLISAAALGGLLVIGLCYRPVVVQ